MDGQTLYRMHLDTAGYIAMKSGWYPAVGNGEEYGE